MKFGAKDVSKIREGEWWRVLTAMWLHGGVVHLGMNSMALFGLGKDIEEEYGTKKFVAIYVPSGIFGATLSAIFLPWQVGVGASGALFGLFGSCWSDLMQNPHDIAEGEMPKEILRITLMTILNLGMGLTPFLDNFAHGGGFVLGFLTGLVVLPKPKLGQAGLTMQQRGMQVLAGVFAVVFVLAAFVVLYTGVDALEKCSWCSSISCVDTPWWKCADIERQSAMPECTRFSKTREDAEEDVLLCGSDQSCLECRHDIPKDMPQAELITTCEVLCAGT